ncbi:late embryogenesis abundant protein 29-like [Coffea eugenioides]|uniref:late embryogenesis abundant protein 29-like n=1 Tax=Coffea eugenioides TaxID=49369 RepID=UPI000F604D87|nr:late embryogenesis abundant protein 29-like [Coffea eugenioides]
MDRNPTTGYTPAQVPGQAQMRRNDQVDQPNQDYATNFLQETGSHLKDVAQGAADAGKGAVLGAASMARGAAAGAANIAHGAADAVKHTLGLDATGNADNTCNWPSSNHPAAAGNSTTDWPSHGAADSNLLGNTNRPTSNLADTTNYPANLMDDSTNLPGSLHNNPNARKNI